MSSDDIIDMIETGVGMIWHEVNPLVGMTWSNNHAWTRDKEGAAMGSLHLRQDMARLVNEKFRRLIQGIRMMYTSEHPLHHRFDKILRLVGMAEREKLMHDLFSMMIKSLPGYVPAGDARKEAVYL